MDNLQLIKRNNSFKKTSKSKNNQFAIKIETLTNKTNTNKTNKTNKVNTYINKRKFLMNTYKTLSEISTKQNENKNIDDTVINIPNISSNKDNIYDSNSNGFLIIEEIFNTDRDNKNNKNKNKNKKENGIFNGDTLFFDANGLKYGLRGKKDGYGFFGTFTHYHGKIINDYILNINFGEKNKNDPLSFNSNLNNEEYNNNIPIVYFAIYYEKENKKYFLKNVRKINYNNIETFIFSFAIYQRYISNNIKIKENIIICFNENQNFVLAMIPMNNYILKVYLIKLDRVDNKKKYCKSVVIYKSCFENNGVSKIIGNKGNIKIDLQGKNYLLNYNKNERCWEIKSNDKNIEIFWIMIDKKTELTKDNVFKINSQFFKIIYNKI